MARAFVFPGQGSQVVGMGRALYDAFGAARAVYQEVDDALGQRLSRIIFDGPDDDLTLTENAQPALMATSLAAARAVESEGGAGSRRAPLGPHWRRRRLDQGGALQGNDFRGRPDA